MQSIYQRYKVRSGSIDLGREYEFKVIALLSLRCFSENAKEIRIASNADSTGAFDDIILRATFTAKKDLACMLQLKHKESPRNITEQEFLSAKGDFSLQKYCSDIDKLKLCSDSDVLGELGDFNDINFVLFTNRGVFEYEFLDKICDSDSVLSILNTNKGNLTGYKFNFNKLPCNSSINSDNCKNLYLFSSQAHAKHLDKEIAAEITRIIGKLQLTHVSIKFVVEKYTKFITQWAMGDLGGHYYLTKQDICNKLSELLFCQYEVDLCEEYGFYIEDERYIWNKIVSDKFVTLVDADDHVLRFLKCYIGSMVRKYIPKHELVNLWTDNFSEQTQQLFYQEIDDIKVQMLKVVGNQGCITLLDVYKCLWFHYKLPLLLEANNAQEYKNIMQILKLSNYSFKIIICNRSLISFTIVEGVSRRLITLSDLSSRERSAVLDRPIQFQGRSSTPLRNLIDDDLLEEIKCKDIIYILSNDFNIGNKYKPVADYFVERILCKIFIKLEAISSIKDEFFLIKKTSDVANEVLENSFANIIILDENGSWKEVEKLKSQGKVIHRLVLCDGHLEWKETFGSVKNIRQHLLENVEDVTADEGIDVEDFMKSNILNTSRIISADPGMGKSTLLDYIATKQCDMWILRVDLNDHHKYYEALKRKTATAVDHLIYFNDFTLEKCECSNSKLARLVFQNFLSAKRVLVLLDGFDEISIHYKDEVTKITKSLHDDHHHIWITTRPNMKSYLEEQLNTLSVTLKPFTKPDQVYFLTKYFMRVCGNPVQEPLVVNFIMKLLEAAQANLNDWRLEFTGVPLQTMLLADVFSDQLKISLTKDCISFNDKFDLLYLYEEFINRKIEICCGKFGIASKNLHSFVKEHQQLFALKYLFRKEDLQEFDVNGKLKEYYKGHEKIHLLQLEGVLVVHKTDDENEDKFEVSFVHRTFAEYLAAQWFAEKVIKKDVNVKRYMKALLGEKEFKCADYFYAFIFKMFNCLLGKNSKAHLALIHGQTDRLKQIIKTNPDALDTVDAGGRTILHLMAIYSKSYLTCFEVSDAEDKILSIMKEIPNRKITGRRDFVLGYSALDYALVNWNLEVANVMCEKSQTLRLNVEIHMPTQYFLYCAQFKLRSLFKVLLLHFAREHVLFWKYGCGRNMAIATFCSTHSDSFNKCLQDFAKDFGVHSVWELFQFENLNDLRFAAAYGNKEILHFLLSKRAKINGQDLYGNTALHYAVSHERLAMVRLLLSEGAAVDVAGRRGCTALHHAAKSGCKRIMDELLNRGADVNKRNDKGHTPFYYALKYSRLDIAKLLLLRGAKSNVKGFKGKISLHYAAKNGLHEIIAMVLSSAFNDSHNFSNNGFSTESSLCSSAGINHQDSDGRTPLHSSVKWTFLKNSERLHRHQMTVFLLLERGADVNIQDKDGNTPLHYICKLCSIHPELRKQFAVYVVELFLLKGANASLQNKQGQTALDVAVHYERDEIVSILQRISNGQPEVKNVTILNPPMGTEILWSNCVLF